MNILNPPVMIDDTIYKKGHGNRKTPEEWKVCYLGWNGHNWDITVSRYETDENDTFIGTCRFTEEVLNDIIWFTSAEAYQNNINKENK